jgi:hypothetical protein
MGKSGCAILIERCLMSIPRCDVVDPLSIQVLHVFNRCVRRAFLCGVDSVSGQDYSHRKEWIRQRRIPDRQNPKTLPVLLPSCIAGVDVFHERFVAMMGPRRRGDFSARRRFCRVSKRYTTQVPGIGIYFH